MRYDDLLPVSEATPRVDLARLRVASPYATLELARWVGDKIR